MATSYFNETGPIYLTEHVQAKEIVNFVYDHVTVAASNGMGSHSGRESAWFDWQAFRAAVAHAPELSTEHDLTTIIPSSPNSDTATHAPNPTTKVIVRHVPDTTIKTILDALVSRFASTFTNSFVPSGAADIDQCSQTYFFDTLRKNLYHAFTHHLEASDAPERCLSFHACTGLDANARPRSAWEYRLLFVHSAGRSKTVRALVMTVTLEGRLEERRGGGEEEAWYGVSLDSRGPFLGTLSAMQLIVGENFRCP